MWSHQPAGRPVIATRVGGLADALWRADRLEQSVKFYDRLLEVAPRNLRLEVAFRVADDILRQADHIK